MCTFTSLEPQIYEIEPFSFTLATFPGCALVPVKFQVILINISPKIYFLRWVVILTFGTLNMASVVSFMHFTE